MHIKVLMMYLNKDENALRFALSAIRGERERERERYREKKRERGRERERKNKRE